MSELDILRAAADHVSFFDEQFQSVNVFQLVGHLRHEPVVVLRVADERIEVLPPTGLHWSHHSNSNKRL